MFSPVFKYYFINLKQSIYFEKLNKLVQEQAVLFF